MKEVRISHFISWVFGIVVFIIGALNLFLVHPVPGIIFLLLSFIYFPPVNDLLIKRFDFSIHPIVKIIQGIVIIIWFTLGVSGLGDMIAYRGSQGLSDTNKMEVTVGEVYFLDFFIESMKQ